jgi:hypothetical protein
MSGLDKLLVASPMLRWSTCMAGSVTFLERRIDMILTSTERRAGSPTGRVVAAAFFIAWSVFSLTGATGVQAGTATHESLTQQTLDEHATRVVARIARYPADISLCAAMRVSTISGSARVVMLPMSSYSPAAIFLRMRRMILPDRVLGNPGTMRI